MSDAPAFTDPSRHILSATARRGRARPERERRRARRPTSSPAPIAPAPPRCWSVSAAGRSARSVRCTTVAAVPADNCPTGLGFVARFTGVTLPDSIENTDGTLATPTELRVRVVDAVNPSSVGNSVAVDLWVDTDRRRC